MASKVALVADDDEFFRLALAAILTTKLSFSEAIQAGSLDEAIDRLASGSQISLAIFDLSMPGMQSAASLRAVRESFDELTVVVVSASRRREDILLALDAGVHGYVPKGLGTGELTRALQMVLEGHIYVPRSITTVQSAEPKQHGSSSQSTLVQQHPDGASLTPRQREVLALLIAGKSNKEIARALKLGEGTVKVHVAALFRSLSVTSRSAAAGAGAKLLSPFPQAQRTFVRD